MEDDDLDAAELLHNPAAFALFECVADWCGTEQGIPGEVDRILVEIVVSLRSRTNPLTDREVQGIRMRVLGLAALLGNDARDVNPRLLANVERELHALNRPR